MKASGSPQVVGDSNWFCDTDLGGLGCTNTGGGGLAPGNSLDVTGFSVSPTMPDGGGSQVQFQVQHPGDPFTDAGVGSGPPDPCPPRPRSRTSIRCSSPAH